MAIKNVPAVIGAEGPLRTWKDASAALRSNAVGLALLGQLLEKADQAEELLTTAQDRLDRLVSAADQKATTLAEMEDELARLTEIVQARRQVLEAEIHASLDALRVAVAERMAVLKDTLAKEEKAHHAAMANVREQRDALESNLAERRIQARDDLEVADRALKEKRTQLREVTAALDAIRKQIG